MYCRISAVRSDVFLGYLAFSISMATILRQRCRQLTPCQTLLDSHWFATLCGQHAMPLWPLALAFVAQCPGPCGLLPWPLWPDPTHDF